MTRIKPAFYKRLCRSLEEYTLHGHAIRDAQEKLDELEREVETGVAGIDYGKDVVQSSGTDSIIERIAISRAELAAWYEHRIRSSKAAHDLMTKALGILTKEEQAVVMLKHCRRFYWSEIAEELGYSDRQCRRFRNAGMAKLALYIYGEQAREVDPGEG